jgi:hypothetical protein
MATKKKRPSGGRAKVKKLKVKREKVGELTDRDATKVRGGMTSARYSPATSKH